MLQILPIVEASHIVTDALQPSKGVLMCGIVGENASLQIGNCVQVGLLMVRTAGGAGSCCFAFGMEI